ncbi:hypothetical protein [Nocardia abscessus]|uniref:hypothetical protein n=1 Tax=Nocardia abscessus TaxID=120957 RepID=UPI002454528C|nr:hypothetical protein [Nocardia abscessus]
MRGEEATRYLCAAVHFDSALASEVVEKVLEEPLRSVARSPGVDLVAVAKHAVAARERQLARNLVMIATMVVVVGNQLAAADFDAGPLGLLLILDPSRLLSPLSLGALLVGWLAVWGEGCSARWGGTANSLRRGTFRSSAAPAPRKASVRQQIEHVAAYSDGNVTAYHGYQPFLGHGWPLSAWSMALDITRPGSDQEPVRPFTAVELNERLRKEIAQLDMRGLNVYNRLFVNGGDIHHDGRFLPDPTGRPVDRVPETTIEALMTSPEDRARPYLTAEIVGWGGEVVWTAFVRLAVSASSLFVEANYCALPPLRQVYHEIDDLLLRPRPSQVLRLAWRSLLSLPRTYWHAVPDAVRQLLGDFRRERKHARQVSEISQVFTFDHGALISVREAAGDLRVDRRGRSIRYHRYFQLLDQEMFTKTVEKKIFETLAQFLTERNVDPDELIRRGEQIINSSVTINGDATLLNSAIGGVSARVASAPAESSRNSPLRRRESE